MKRLLLSLATGVALAATSVVAQAATLATYYDSSSRTIYLIPASDFMSPRVYLATRNYFTGKCSRDGGVMNLMPTVKLSTSLQASLKATAKMLAAQMGSGTRIDVTLPSVYYYNYTSMIQVGLRYNVVATDFKTKRNQETGWLPNPGSDGCAYIVPK